MTPHEHSASESAAQPREPQCLICLNKELISLRAQVKTFQYNLKLPVIRQLLLKRDAVIEYLQDRLEQRDRGES